MIGLGSNRLSVCRRGGMSVTQAGRGGMEWLAGGRVPDWITPYSAQATAALKAQFPTQWETIREYGFAHPEIVGYMNAYAPEDAKIAYSLVEGIGFRGLQSDGNAYIDTGYAVNRSTTRFRADVKIKYSNASGYHYHGFSANSGGFMGLAGGNIVGTSVSGSTYVGQLLKLGFRFNGNSDIKFYVNDELKATQTNGSGSNGNWWWYIINWSSKEFNNKYDNVAEASLSDLSGNLIQRLFPFKLGVARSADQVYPSSKGAQAVGTLGMLDLVTGLFHPNANSSGSFTISETPAS